MALEDFIQEPEEKPNEYHENDKLNKAKLHEPNLCPSCGAEGEKTHYGDWRCPKPLEECDTITWFVPTKRHA